MIAVPPPLPQQKVRKVFEVDTLDLDFHLQAFVHYLSSARFRGIWAGIFVKRCALVCQVDAPQPDLSGEMNDGEGDDVRPEIKYQLALFSERVSEVIVPRVPDVNDRASQTQGFGQREEPANAPAGEESQECPQKRRSKRRERGAGQKREGE